MHNFFQHLDMMGQGNQAALIGHQEIRSLKTFFTPTISQALTLYLIW